MNGQRLYRPRRQSLLCLCLIIKVTHANHQLAGGKQVISLRPDRQFGYCVRTKQKNQEFTN